MTNEYIVSPSTIAILPINESISRVVEEDDVYMVKKSTRDIIDDSCKYYGSSFNGRKEGTKALLGYNYKVPIVIDMQGSVIIFPISSARYNNTSWISLKKIKRFEKNNEYSKVYFKNDTILTLPISYNSLETQVLRASYLNQVIEERKNHY